MIELEKTVLVVYYVKLIVPPSIFHLLCTCHNTPDKQVRDYYESGDLVHQIDWYSCIWSQYRNEFANLHLIISKYLTNLINNFNITGILERSNLNGFGS